MKTTILLRGISAGILVYFALAVQAQTPVKDYDKNGGAFFQKDEIRTSLITDQKPESVLAPVVRKRINPPSAESQAACTVNDIRMGTSSNAYSVAWYNFEFLYADPNLKTIVMTHRSNPAVTGDAGSLFYRYDVSKDGGKTWVNNVGPVYNSTLPPGLRASYPQNGIYNPPSNTKSDSAYLVFYGPTINGAGTKWNGHAYGTHQLSGLKPPVQRADTFVNSFTCWDSHMTLNGIFYSLDIGLSADYVDTLIISKGTFNNTSKDFDYIRTKLYAPLTLTSSKRILDAKIAFAPNGTTGYVAIAGHNDQSFTTYKDSAYYIILYKTVDGGNNWTGPININISNLTAVQNALLGQITYTIGFELDIAVDAAGNPHVVCPIGGAGVNWNFATVATPGDWGIFDVYSEDGGSTFKAQLLREPGNFWGAFGDQSNGTQFYVYPHSQVSTTADGNKLFFAWFETDTLNFGSGWDQNLYPDPWMKGYDVTTKKWTATKNMVVDCPNLMGLSTMGLISQYTLSNAGVYTIPTMYTQLAFITSTIDSVKYHYLDGIQFTDAEFVGIGDEETKLISSLTAYPNPSSGTEITLEVKTESNADMQVSVYDMMGKTVMQLQSDNRPAGTHRYTISTSALPAGMYHCTVSNGTDRRSTRIVIE